MERGGEPRLNFEEVGDDVELEAPGERSREGFEVLEMELELSPELEMKQELVVDIGFGLEMGSVGRAGSWRPQLENRKSVLVGWSWKREQWNGCRMGVELEKVE